MTWKGFFVEGLRVTTELLIVNLAVSLAALVQALAGLGFVMVAAPLIALVNLAYLPGPILVANICLSSVMFWRDGRSLARVEVAPLVGGLLIGTAIGAGFLTLVSTERLGIVFALVILGAVAISVFAPQLPLTRRNVLFGATGGGFTGIVAGMHAPPLVMLYQRETPEKIRATFATVFIIGIVFALFGLWLAGRFGIAEVWMGLSLLPGLVVGFGAGRLLAARVTKEAVRLAMLTISTIGGVALLIDSL